MDPARIALLEPGGSYLCEWKVYLHSPELRPHGEINEDDWRIARGACELVLVTEN